MGSYMAMLDKKQQSEFKENLKEENQTLKNQSSEERQEKIQERFKSLFGKISHEQVEILNAQKDYFEQRHKVRLNRRKKLHAKFWEIYKMDVSESSKAHEFYEAFEEYQVNYPENEKNKEILKKTASSLSDEQKEVFKRKMNELKEILSYYLETVY
jgi:FtsZ-binding cell division protein ZapB